MYALRYHTNVPVLHVTGSAEVDLVYIPNSVLTDDDVYVHVTREIKT